MNLNYTACGHSSIAPLYSGLALQRLACGYVFMDLELTNDEVLRLNYNDFFLRQAHYLNSRQGNAPE
jgi:hypothetical protein